MAEPITKFRQSVLRYVNRLPGPVTLSKCTERHAIVENRTASARNTWRRTHAQARHGANDSSAHPSCSRTFAVRRTLAFASPRASAPVRRFTCRSGTRPTRSARGVQRACMGDASSRVCAESRCEARFRDAGPWRMQRVGIAFRTSNSSRARFGWRLTTTPASHRRIPRNITRVSRSCSAKPSSSAIAAEPQVGAERVQVRQCRRSLRRPKTDISM